MSQTTASIPPAGFAKPGEGYRLSDDLARLCLPTEFKESWRKLAWVNSICFLFLVIGMVGLKPPRIIQHAVTTPQESVPVVFTPPEEQPKPQPVVKQEEPQEEQQDAPVEAPQIPTVVAANTPNVAFAVPVEGAVVLAPVSRAPPPPPVTHAPPAQPKTFIPGRGEGGTFPWPTSYPREAMDQRLQGTVTLYVVVAPDGRPEKVEIKESSRHSVLDNFAMQWIKTHWRWLPGDTRQFYVPFQFTLQGG